MVTTRGGKPEDTYPTSDLSTTPAFRRALSLGLRYDGALLSAEHPEYLRYYRRVPPMDFRVAFSRFSDKGESLNAVLTRLGYDVGDIDDPVRVVKEDGEAIKPRTSW